MNLVLHHFPLSGKISDYQNADSLDLCYIYLSCMTYVVSQADSGSWIYLSSDPIGLFLPGLYLCQKNICLFMSLLQDLSVSYSLLWFYLILFLITSSEMEENVQLTVLLYPRLQNEGKYVEISELDSSQIIKI